MTLFETNKKAYVSGADKDQRLRILLLYKASEYCQYRSKCCFGYYYGVIYYDRVIHHDNIIYHDGPIRLKKNFVEKTLGTG